MGDVQLRGPAPICLLDNWGFEHNDDKWSNHFFIVLQLPLLGQRCVYCHTRCTLILRKSINAQSSLISLRCTFLYFQVGIFMNTEYHIRNYVFFVYITLLENIVINFKFMHLKHTTNKMHAIHIPLHVCCAAKELANSTLENFLRGNPPTR